MIKTQFPAAIAVVSKAIKTAETKEEQDVCNAFIEHVETDFMFFAIPTFIEDIQGLRDQLQVKYDELKTNH